LGVSIAIGLAFRFLQNVMRSFRRQSSQQLGCPAKYPGILSAPGVTELARLHSHHAGLRELDLADWTSAHHQFFGRAFYLRFAKRKRF
jgi:hypothetical protein